MSIVPALDPYAPYIQLPDSRVVKIEIRSHEWMVTQQPEDTSTTLVVNWTDRQITPSADRTVLWYTPCVPTFTVQGNGNVRVGALDDVFAIQQTLTIKVSPREADCTYWGTLPREV